MAVKVGRSIWDMGYCSQLSNYTYDSHACLEIATLCSSVERSFRHFICLQVNIVEQICCGWETCTHTKFQPERQANMKNSLHTPTRDKPTLVSKSPKTNIGHIKEASKPYPSQTKHFVTKGTAKTIQKTPPELHSTSNHSTTANRTAVARTCLF